MLERHSGRLYFIAHDAQAFFVSSSWPAAPWPGALPADGMCISERSWSQVASHACFQHHAGCQFHELLRALSGVMF